MSRRLTTREHRWRLREPFRTSRGPQTLAGVVIVELHDGPHLGRGEAAGVPYAGETPESMRDQVESVRAAIEAGATRAELLDLLPAGGARNALDAALWDLEAKASGRRAWQLAGVGCGSAVTSAVTIGIRTLAEYAASARALADHPWIKLKVGHEAPLEAVRVVREAAPAARLIVDANQAWTVDDVRRHLPALQALGVALLEQPVRAGEDAGLASLDSPIPICADESIQTADDLPALAGRYAFVNIKLDKTGGLTAALALAAQARASGLRLMSGCMVSGSVAMAPAMVLAQLCEVNDLDGPFLQGEDWPGGIRYERGVMSPPWPQLWG